MYKNICFGKIKFPRGVIGDDGKQFVKGVSVIIIASWRDSLRLTDCLVSCSTGIHDIDWERSEMPKS